MSGLGIFNTRRMLSKTKWDLEQIDTQALWDRSLTDRENRSNIASMYGIRSGPDTGSRRLGQQEQHRSFLQSFRSDPLYQVGFSNTEIDRRFQAMPPGKRYSRGTGHKYYERRENRSDRGRLL